MLHFSCVREPTPVVFSRAGIGGEVSVQHVFGSSDDDHGAEAGLVSIAASSVSRLGRGDGNQSRRAINYETLQDPLKSDERDGVCYVQVGLRDERAGTRVPVSGVDRVGVETYTGGRSSYVHSSIVVLT